MQLILVVFWLISGIAAAIIASKAGIVTPENPRRFIVGSIWLGPISLTLVLLKIWYAE